MKKKTILVAILSFFLSTCIGYFYGRGTQDMVAEEPMEITLEESMEVNQKTNTIATDGQLIYQYYYTKDHTLKEQQEVTPDFLVGLTREHVSCHTAPCASYVLAFIVIWYILYHHN